MAQEGDENDDGSIYAPEQEEEEEEGSGIGDDYYQDYFSQYPDIPDIDIEDLSPISLRRLQINNPFHSCLSVGSYNWIEGAGLAIRNSTELRDLIVDCDGSPYQSNHWLLECCLGISHNRSLHSLGLCKYRSRLDLFQILIPFFKHNKNLRSLELQQFDSEHSLMSLCSALSHCKKDNCLEEIDLEAVNYRSDKDVGVFFDLIGEQFRSLLTLSFRRTFLKRVGCTSVANLLYNPVSKIEHLQLGNNNLDVECTTILRDALITNESLETITIYGRFTFETITGWQVFCTIFAHEMCTIRQLRFGDTLIGDVGVTTLGDSLATNTSLVSLHIVDDNSITSVGWQGLSQCLRSRNSALEDLTIGILCSVDEGGAVAIVSALANNTTLNELNLHNDKESFFNILTQILWDKSSIDSTYTSNHTLRKIIPLYKPFRDDIRRLLKMNRNEDKAEVARQTILHHHFSEGNANIHVFAAMPETSLPFAIAWIGRNKDGRTLMYNFAQAFPSLLNIGHK